MGVAAEHERVAQLRSLLVGLRAVAQENGGLSRRNRGPGFREIVGAKKMRIVHSTDPQPRTVPFDGFRFIEQDLQAGGFQKCHLLDEIVIAQNSQARTLEMRHETPHQFEGTIMGFGDFIVIITGQNDRIVCESRQTLNHHINEVGIEVAMQVG